MIDQKLLEILACPLCKKDVELKNDKLVCVNCGRRYPVKDDIPIMLIDEAELPESGK
ncbi:MAG: Trm112 family protein [Planctomycetes bacterium]|nr:Trm112 family protein [Planctomycetota bacterium]